MSMLTCWWPWHGLVVCRCEHHLQVMKQVHGKAGKNHLYQVGRACPKFWKWTDMWGMCIFLFVFIHCKGWIPIAADVTWFHPKAGLEHLIYKAGCGWSPLKMFESRWAVTAKNLVDEIVQWWTCSWQRTCLKHVWNCWESGTGTNHTYVFLGAIRFMFLRI